MKQRDLKRRVFELLEEESLADSLKELFRLPPRRAVNPLFSALLSTKPILKWRAVTALGTLIARLASLEMESARVVMRRLMWQLNDESGGIGWGCPETMGEAVAGHRGLAEEFAPVLVSYIDEQGNFLEYPPLQQGALWGVGRAAEGSPDLLQQAIPLLIPFLHAGDAVLRALAANALGRLKTAPAEVATLLKDEAEVVLFLDRKLHTFQVKELAAEAIGRMRDPAPSG